MNTKGGSLIGSVFFLRCLYIVVLVLRQKLNITGMIVKKGKTKFSIGYHFKAIPFQNFDTCCRSQQFTNPKKLRHYLLITVLNSSAFQPIPPIIVSSIKVNDFDKPHFCTLFPQPENLMAINYSLSSNLRCILSNPPLDMIRKMSLGRDSFTMASSN